MATLLDELEGMRVLSPPLSGSGRSGMSLLELVSVLAVLTVLFGLGVAVADGVKERTLRMETQGTLTALRGLLERHRLEWGSYPLVETGDAASRIHALGSALGDGDARDERESTWTDAWGRPLYYAFSDAWGHGQYVLVSCGPDGLMEPEDGSGRYGAGIPANRDNVGGMAW